MSFRIGILLPRATDYPAISFDILDGLRLQLKERGITDAQLIVENIGFGDDLGAMYARAEKFLMQDDVHAVIAFANEQNAETLFSLAESSGKPFIFLSAGMQFCNRQVPEACAFISLQGLQAMERLGQMAGEGGKKVLMATSFFDAGFRSSMAAAQGIGEAGGAVCGNYVSSHRISEFSIDTYLELLRDTQPDSVLAGFSIYLGDLFLTALKAAGDAATVSPFYCSPFMCDEQLLPKSDFPGGTFHAVMPWAHSLDNAAQQAFIRAIETGKSKPANLFHLLGWEAGIVVCQALTSGINSLPGWAYESPRGKVTIHPATRTTYAPLYKGRIVSGNGGKCSLEPDTALEVSDHDHLRCYVRETDGIVSGWRNSYFCA